MKLIFIWCVVLGILWIAAFVSLQVLVVEYPGYADQLGHSLAYFIGVVGPAFGRFIAPILQFALITYILINIAERLGFQKNSLSLSIFEVSNNIQTLIALTVVGAFSISAVVGIGNVGALKDICLVVVGFYFGTRRRADAHADALAAGEAGAAVVSAAIKGQAEGSGGSSKTVSN